jgi:hypothetical protein
MLPNKRSSVNKRTQVQEQIDKTNNCAFCKVVGRCAYLLDAGHNSVCCLCIMVAETRIVQQNQHDSSVRTAVVAVAVAEKTE